MPQNRNYISTEILSLISAFAILALAGFVTLRADEYRRDTGASLRHTITVENALHRLYGTIRGIESDERGYLITHDARYLEFNKDAIDQIVKDLNIVSALISADKAQSVRLAELRPLLSERLRLLSLKRELIQSGEFEKAIDVIKSGSVKISWIQAPSDATNSWTTTASAPSGMGAPVKIRRHSPGPSLCSGAAPALTVPTIRSLAPGTASAALTA